MQTFRFLAVALPVLVSGLCAKEPVQATAQPKPIAPAAAAEAEKKEDYIRVQEDDKSAQLQTALLRYEKNGAKVDLVGAVHIADKAYYEDLQKRFNGYDAVLFEMVGGDQAARLPGGPAEERSEASGLSKLYAMVAKFLNLSEQACCLDYRQKNFVHADLTLDEFTRLQSERKESLLSFALKNGTGDKSQGPDPKKLLNAVLAGKPNQTKLELIHTLGGGDDQMAALTGESVIISDRNKKALSVLDQQLAQGRKNLAVFYGAAHFVDMNQRMLERGFRLMNTEWLTAWNIPKEGVAPAAILPEATAPAAK